MFVWSARNIGCWDKEDSRLFIGRIRTATFIAFSSDMVAAFCGVLVLVVVVVRKDLIYIILYILPQYIYIYI